MFRRQQHVGAPGEPAAGGRAHDVGAMDLPRPRQPSQVEARACKRGHGLGTDERLGLAPHRRARTVTRRRRMRHSELLQ